MPRSAVFGSTPRRTTKSPGSASAEKEATAATKAARPRAQGAPVDTSAFVPSFALAADAWQNSLPSDWARRVIFLCLPARNRATSVPMPRKPGLVRVCGWLSRVGRNSPQEGGHFRCNAETRGYRRRRGAAPAESPRGPYVSGAWTRLVRPAGLSGAGCIVETGAKAACMRGLPLCDACLCSAAQPWRRAGSHAETGTLQSCRGVTVAPERGSSGRLRSCQAARVASLSALWPAAAIAAGQRRRKGGRCRRPARQIHWKSAWAPAGCVRSQRWRAGQAPNRWPCQDGGCASGSWCPLPTVNGLRTMGARGARASGVAWGLPAGWFPPAVPQNGNIPASSLGARCSCRARHAPGACLGKAHSGLYHELGNGQQRTDNKRTTNAGDGISGVSSCCVTP